MVASGVQTVRVAFNWSAAQPYASWSDVPAGQTSQFVSAGGMPTNFAPTDKIVSLAAQRRLKILPTVLYAPLWDTGSNIGRFAPPARNGPYAAYLTALIKRYGPHGTFWSHHRPRLPIRWWQIWNEENLTYYWSQPFAKSYVALLRAAHAAIKRVDPGAKVVLGALTDVAWNSLEQIERVRGARAAFDTIAADSYTATPADVIRYLQLMRRAAQRHGDANKPMLVTEWSWLSSKGHSPQNYTWTTTEQGQAANVAAMLPMLAANRKALKLVSVYYYTWMGQEQDGGSAWNFAGLLRLDPTGQIVAKPAFRAFQRVALAVERCRQKARIATGCVR